MVGLISCNKELNIESTHFVTEKNQWRTLSDARTGLMGIYSLMRAALAENHTHWLMGELRKGDFVPYVRSDFKAISEDNLTASYPLLNDLTNWRRFYAVVNSASVFIEKAPSILATDRAYTESNMKLDIAQARALRAFAYFYMSRIWGDLPLITSSYDNGSFPEVRKSSAKQVLDFAEDELLVAVRDLPFQYGVAPDSYYGKQTAYWQGALFNKISAYAILSHISAWKGEYLKTEAYTDFVMRNYAQANITYSTTAELTSAGSGGTFYGNKARQIVAFPFAQAYREQTTDGHIENLALAEPFTNNQYPQIFVPKDTITAVFNESDNRDDRFGVDTLSGLYRASYFTNFSGSIPVFSKIKIIRQSSGDYNLPLYGSAVVFTRLEEIALLRAEALAILEREDEAITLLNILRANRKLVPYLSSSGVNVLQAIFQERRKELMGEGWRWYDQIRLNRLENINPEIQELITQGGAYWPISEDILLNNRNVNQNDYWK